MRIWSFLIAFCLFFSSLTAQGNYPTRVVNGKTYYVHKVLAGETLYKIAKKYGSTVATVQAANPTVKVLHPGDEVLIPKPQTGTPVPQPVVTPAPQPESPGTYISYTVKKGETLSKIAKAHNTTVEELKKINHITGTGLKIGQVIKVPSGVVVNQPAENPPAPVNTPVTDSVKQEPVPVVVPKPETPTVVKPDDKTNPGMPVVPRVTVPETAVEKEENASAVVVTDKMDQSRTFVMHPTLPKGSIVVLINENTGKMAYCRVIDNIATSDLNGAGIAVTRAVADKIGMDATLGNVKIKYAAP